MSNNKRAKPAKLTAAQKRSLGAVEPWMWHESYAHLHPPADPLTLCEGEEDEQTYRQFMEMAKREPNERGTGRWKLEQEEPGEYNDTVRRNTISILALDSGVENNLVEQVQQYLQAFFFHGGVSVEIHPFHGRADIGKNNTLRLKPPPQQSPSKKKRKRTQQDQSKKLQNCLIEGEPYLEVFSLFDAMVPSFIMDHHYCVLGLTSHNLAEQWKDDDDDEDDDGGDDTATTTPSAIMAVLGRACGDRVCVVQATTTTTPASAMPLVTLLATCTHELLHCFGFDHCTTFRCVMNAQSVQDEECLFLSPLNLKKWIVGVLGLSSSSSSSLTAAKHDTAGNGSSWTTPTTTMMTAMEYAVERYRALKQVLSRHHEQEDVQAHMDWLDQKIAALQAVATTIDKSKPHKVVKDNSNKRKRK